MSIIPIKGFSLPWPGYAAHGYVALLEAHGTQISMAAVGRPMENPYAERLIRTLKEEEVYLPVLARERLRGL